MESALARGLAPANYTTDRDTIVTVLLALFAIHVWRVQLVMKRRFEVAEEALQVSQQVVYALSEIRDLWSLNEEGKSRKRSPDETPEESARLDEAYIPFERIAKYDQLFATLSKSILLVEIQLGEDLATSMRALRMARSRVIGAARSMERLSRKEKLDEKDRRRMKQYAAELYETNQRDAEEPLDNDILTPHIEKMLEEIESGCRRYLSTPKFKDSLNVWSDK